jgi:hypothetical protein
MADADAEGDTTAGEGVVDMLGAADTDGVMVTEAVLDGVVVGVGLCEGLGMQSVSDVAAVEAVVSSQ